MLKSLLIPAAALFLATPILSNSALAAPGDQPVPGDGRHNGPDRRGRGQHKVLQLPPEGIRGRQSLPKQHRAHDTQRRPIPFVAAPALAAAGVHRAGPETFAVRHDQGAQGGDQRLRRVKPSPVDQLPQHRRVVAEPDRVVPGPAVDRGREGPGGDARRVGDPVPGQHAFVRRLDFPGEQQRFLAAGKFQHRRGFGLRGRFTHACIGKEG